VIPARRGQGDHAVPIRRVSPRLRVKPRAVQFPAASASGRPGGDDPETPQVPPPRPTPRDPRVRSERRATVQDAGSASTPGTSAAGSGGVRFLGGIGEEGRGGGQIEGDNRFGRTSVPSNLWRIEIRRSRGIIRLPQRGDDLLRTVTLPASGTHHPKTSPGRAGRESPAYGVNLFSEPRSLPNRQPRAPRPMNRT
jgi:hypothetical protein